MNTHIRKAVAVVAIGAMSVSLAACGSSNSQGGASGSGKLTVAWWGNQTRNDRQKQVDELFASKHEGLSIDGQFSQYNDYWQKLATNAAGKTLPDVIQMDFSYLSQYIDNKLLEPLDDYVSSGKINLSDVDENTISSGRGTDGKLYALPSAVNAPTMVYNKTLLDSLGITIPDDWTLEDFENIAREVYAKSGVRTHFGYMGDAYNLEYNLRAHDIALFDGDKLGTTDPKYYEEYFKVFADGYKEGWHLTAEFYTGITLNSQEQSPLVNYSSPETQSWVSLSWSNQIVSFAKVNDKNELALAPWPSANVKKSNYVLPSQYWAITRTSKNKDLAADFINFYTNEAEAAKIMLTDRGIPISSKMIDAITPSLTQYEKAAADYQKTVGANSSPINQPMPAKATEINSRVIPAIEESIMYGKLDAAGAAQEFIAKAQDALK